MKIQPTREAAEQLAQSSASVAALQRLHESELWLQRLHTQYRNMRVVTDE